MNFASLILEGNKNVSLIIVENGMGNVIKPIKPNEEFSKYLLELLKAERIYSEGSKKSTIPSFNEKLIPKEKLIDLTIKKDYNKCKTFYNLMKEEKLPLEGLIEAVLSGSRLKVRIIKHNIIILILLNGIKCLPNDENMKEYLKYSTEALNYTVENILQREVIIELDSLDTKCIFTGSIFNSKRNYSETLLSNGLAHCFSIGKVQSKYNDNYKKLEAKAREDKKGIWSNDKLKLNYLFEDSSFQELSNIKQEEMQVSEIISSSTFYLQKIKKSEEFLTIEKFLNNFKGNSEPLEGFIKKGTPCLAKFSYDNKWYRARVEKFLNNGNFEVFFVDFGNIDEVAKYNLKKISPEINSIEGQAFLCSLAYLRMPSNKGYLVEKVDEYFKKKCWGKKFLVDICYKRGDRHFAVIDSGKDETINEHLLLCGYAKIIRESYLPAKYKFWKNLQEKAEEKKIGLWKFDNDEDEEYYY